MQSARQNTLFGPRGVCAAFAAACLTIGGPAFAGDLHVPSQFPTIQEAIDAALPGDVVILADGVYTGAGNRDLRLSGKPITVRSANGPQNCVIDAEGTSDEPYRAFIFDGGETHETILDGLTISGGATLPGAVQDQFNGGGLFFRESSATVMNCVIRDNACGCWGGGVYATLGAAPILINCDVSNNASNDDGGAVFVWNGGGATLINCTMTGNWARVTGGAVTDFDGAGNLNIINCTIAANEAPYGSAIFGWSVNVVNSIIWDNFGGDAIHYDQTPVSYSIVQEVHAGPGNIDADPQFVDPAAGNYRVLPGSAAIDAGNVDAVPIELVCVDIDGEVRVVDDIGMINTGAGEMPFVDLGAYEFQGSSRMNAAITEATVSTGTWLGGDESDLEASDDRAFRVRSGNGVTVTEKHMSELFITTDTTHARPTTLDISVESRIDHPAGTVKVALFNFMNYNFEPVGTGPVGESDSVLTFEDIDAAERIGSDGTAYLSLKHVVFAPFLAFRFESATDPRGDRHRMMPFGAEPERKRGRGRRRLARFRSQSQSQDDVGGYLSVRERVSGRACHVWRGLRTWTGRSGRCQNGIGGFSGESYQAPGRGLCSGADPRNRRPRCPFSDPSRCL